MPSTSSANGVPHVSLLRHGLTILSEARHESRILTTAFWFNIALGVFALAAMPFDHRQILGLNPWIKPLKFDISTAIYIATVAILLHVLGPKRDVWPRVRTLIAWVTGLAMMVENAIISTQSLRGVRSHMNYTTVLNAELFGIMGIFIALNTVAVALLLFLWLIRRPDAIPRPAQWGARLGLSVFLAGSLEGVLMVARQGHTVGAPDGGPGLPLVNWSTLHGDLRIAHFFALHALQLMPLLGLGVSRLRWTSTWTQHTQLATVCTACAAYLAAVWLLFHQAMAGHPLFS